MTRFVMRGDDPAKAHLFIDSLEGDELSPEQATVWMLNEIRVHLSGIESTLASMDNSLGYIANKG